MVQKVLLSGVLLLVSLACFPEPGVRWLILGTFIWGVYATLRNVFMKLPGAHPHTANVYEMRVAALLPLAVSFFLPGGWSIPIGFWIPFLLTALLNVFTENWGAKMNRIEKAIVIIPIAGTMPAVSVFFGWWLQGQWPSAWSYLGIYGIMLGVYLMKVGGDNVTLPKLLSKFPEGWHANLKHFLSPFIRIFASPDSDRLSLVGRLTLNGAQFAWLVAWTGALAQQFDQMAVVSANPVFFAGAKWAFVGTYWYSYSNLTGEWPKLDKTHHKKFMLLGALRGTLEVMVCIPLIYMSAAEVGALKRVHILWVTLMSFLFLGETQGLWLYMSRGLGAIILTAGAILIALYK